MDIFNFKIFLQLNKELAKQNNNFGQHSLIRANHINRTLQPDKALYFNKLGELKHSGS